MHPIDKYIKKDEPKVKEKPKRIKPEDMDVSYPKKHISGSKTYPFSFKIPGQAKVKKPFKPKITPEYNQARNLPVGIPTPASDLKTSNDSDSITQSGRIKGDPTTEPEKKSNKAWGWN